MALQVAKRSDPEHGWVKLIFVIIGGTVDFGFGSNIFRDHCKFRAQERVIMIRMRMGVADGESIYCACYMMFSYVSQFQSLSETSGRR